MNTTMLNGNKLTITRTSYLKSADELIRDEEFDIMALPDICEVEMLFLDSKIKEKEVVPFKALTGDNVRLMWATFTKRFWHPIESSVLPSETKEIKWIALKRKPMHVEIKDTKAQARTNADAIFFAFTSNEPNKSKLRLPTLREMFKHSTKEYWVVEKHFTSKSWGIQLVPNFYYSDYTPKDNKIPPAKVLVEQTNTTNYPHLVLFRDI